MKLAELSPKTVVAIAERFIAPQRLQNNRRDTIEVAIIFGAVAAATLAFWALAGVGAWWLFIGSRS